MNTRTDDTDPKVFCHYKSWLASRTYNEWNREARNQKKRERMAALRASQKHDSPTVQAARLAAKEESPRNYCENNRELLAIKAVAARKRAKRWHEIAQEDDMLVAMWQRNRLAHAIHHIESEHDEEENIFRAISLYPDPGQTVTISPRKKLYLVCGRLVQQPGVYESWPSADTQYKNISGATVKSYRDYAELEAAWHARCDLGEHDHPVDPQLAAHGPRNRTPSPPSSEPAAPPSSSRIASAPRLTTSVFGNRAGAISQSALDRDQLNDPIAMDKKKRKRTVYTHNSGVEEPSNSAAISDRRVRVEHHPAPPRSPQKNQARDAFDDLMGFNGDTFMPEVVTPEGPAALKVKVKKGYENSDHPVKTWITERNAYLDGLLQREGRGPWWSNGCAICKNLNATWRCEDCFGNRLLCSGCVIGHPFEEDFPFNYVAQSRILTVIHDNGIHVVDVDFCGCTGAPSEVAQLLNIGWYPATHKEPATAATLSLLRRFHKLNLQARIPAYDFYNTVVLLTNGAGSRKVPDCLQQFMNMVREYRHLQMCKRAGFLPLSPIYRLMVSEDANFKLKGRAQSTREKGPTLGPGSAYMVENTAYLKYLAEHVHEDKTFGHGRSSARGKIPKYGLSVVFGFDWGDFAHLGRESDVRLGTSLLCKMVLVIPQAIIHNYGLWQGHEEDLTRWEKMVRDWEADMDDNPDPYNYAEVEATTMADVLARIAVEEHVRVVKDGTSALTVKPGPFLIEGIEIQQAQAALQLEAKRLNWTTTQVTALQRSCTLLLGNVKVLHDIQDTYMPGLRTWFSQQSPELLPGNQAKPETIPVYPPSSLPAGVRQTVCVSALVKQEEELRCAQASLALRELRSALRTRVFAHRFKRNHLGGQGAYTKSRDLVDGIEDRVRSATTGYRAARTALLALRGSGAWENDLRELRQEDIRGMTERALNDEEKEENKKARRLAGLPEDGTGEDIDEYGEPVELTVLFNLETGEGRRNLSLIWYTGGVRDSDVTADGKLHEDIRVEWTKACARAERWGEELLLLEGEMRCMLEFCSRKAWWWDERINSECNGLSPELAEGLLAYALEHAAPERTWERDWKKKWAAVRERAKVVMRDHIINVKDLVPLEVELEEEIDEEAEDDNEFFAWGDRHGSNLWNKTASTWVEIAGAQAEGGRRGGVGRGREGAARADDRRGGDAVRSMQETVILPRP
ncbi:hypothetical protein K438DRAFT_1933798 [Mycena galopus ATCC 62051]|nr:hypothetical protein K438DRAFT_1933798 [Mycena galopus ATCC 62051]